MKSRATHLLLASPENTLSPHAKQFMASFTKPKNYTKLAMIGHRETIFAAKFPTFPSITNSATASSSSSLSSTDDLLVTASQDGSCKVWSLPSDNPPTMLASVQVSNTNEDSSEVLRVDLLAVSETLFILAAGTAGGHCYFYRVTVERSEADSKLTSATMTRIVVLGDNNKSDPAPAPPLSLT